MTLRIGSRESALALYQTRLVASWIGEGAEIIGITTAGDNQHIPLTGQGTSGLFVNTLRNALVDRRVDLIVHSLKDVPTAPDPRFALAAVPERVDPRDVFVGRDGMGIDDIPSGGVIGTSSPRRAMWVQRLRPDVRVEPIRGNVDTRLAKVARGDFHATLLAAAGLTRLGLLTDAMHFIDTEDLIPAPAQGALGIECRSGDEPAAVTVLDSAQARVAVTAERAVLRELGASCATAAGAHATIIDGVLRLRADVVSTSTFARILVEQSAPCTDALSADAIGVQVAKSLLAEGAAALIESQ